MNIEDAVVNYLNLERLIELRCRMCNTQGQVFQQLCFESLPKMVIIQINSYDEAGRKLIFTDVNYNNVQILYTIFFGPLKDCFLKFTIIPL